VTDQAAPQYITVQGIPVEKDALRIAERVHEYDPSLRVQFLEQANSVEEPPFRIVERCKDGIDRPVFSAWTLDEKVLERIYLADNQKWDISGRLDVTNAKAKAQEGRRFKDKLEEAHEITSTVLASPKSTFTVPENILREEGEPGKLVKFKDHR
jgi:hypothetical protein